MKAVFQKIFYTCICIILFGIIAEVSFRLFLFSSCSENTGHRAPHLYADYFQDDDYWLLRAQWTEGKVAFSRHEELGWIGNFHPQTYRHVEEEHLKGRTPILLFGDSFGACVAGVPCFEDILDEHTQLSKRYYILNYGVGGYGIDQILMLMERVLPLYPESIVITGFMTLDIDRAQLRFREASKPKMDVVDENLILVHTPTDSVQLSIQSYLYRKILFSSYTPPKIRSILRREPQIQANKLARMEHILRKMRRLTQQRKNIFVVFDPLTHIDSDWRRAAVEHWMNDNDIDYVSTWKIHQQSPSNALDDFIRPDGHPTEHFNRLITEEIAIRIKLLEQP